MARKWRVLVRVLYHLTIPWSCEDALVWSTCTCTCLSLPRCCPVPFAAWRLLQVRGLGISTASGPSTGTTSTYLYGPIAASVLVLVLVRVPYRPAPNPPLACFPTKTWFLWDLQKCDDSPVVVSSNVINGSFCGPVPAGAAPLASMFRFFLLH